MTPLEAALGSRVVDERRVSGGDIHDAFRVTLADGRRVFVKRGAAAVPGMFEAEAAGLRWLGEAGALAVPEVLAATDGFLALAFVERGPPAADHDERLGRGLAALHLAGAPGFGFSRDNFLATLLVDNRSAPGWASFYGERRLLPLVATAETRGRASGTTRRAIERLVARLPELLGPEEPPARLHGDLWAGNAMTDRDGAPVLVDPAVFGGHREIDLAMMRLFGGFSADVFDAYAEAFPLAPGHDERVALHQLLPLLAHACLFGGGYAREAESIARRYVG